MGEKRAKDEINYLRRKGKKVKRPLILNKPNRPDQKNMRVEEFLELLACTQNLAEENGSPTHERGKTLGARSSYIGQGKEDLELDSVKYLTELYSEDYRLLNSSYFPEKIIHEWCIARRKISFEPIKDIRLVIHKNEEIFDEINCFIEPQVIEGSTGKLSRLGIYIVFKSRRKGQLFYKDADGIARYNLIENSQVSNRFKVIIDDLRITYESPVIIFWCETDGTKRTIVEVYAVN